MRSSHKLSHGGAVLFALVLWVTIASPLAAGKYVDIPVQSSPKSNGQALLAALGEIRNASPGQPYTIRLSPGIYDVGSTVLQMKPYVDIVGSSPEATIIQGQGDDGMGSRGVVRGASNMALSSLQIRSDGRSSSLALLIEDASPFLWNVAIVSSGGTDVNFGIRHIRSAARFSDVTIDVRGGRTAIGLSSTGLGILTSSPSIEHMTIVAAEADLSIGISSLEFAKLESVRDLQVDASGANAIGIRLLFPYGFEPALDLEGSRITATGTYRAIGVEITSGRIRIASSQIRATAPGGSGVYFYWEGWGTIDLSTIAGPTNTVFGFSPRLRIGNSRLEGGPAIGPTCANVTDENNDAYKDTCP